MAAMEFETLEQGFVARRDPEGLNPVAAGPRVAVTDQGEVVCTYMVQSALGVNDFVPMLARSKDNGQTWQKEGPIWPHLSSSFSLFGSVSRDSGGALYMYGMSVPIDTPGELFWSDATQGIKQNQLFHAVSRDHGRTWCDPQKFSLPEPGSAEAPGALCVTRDGRWVGCYAPYNTFDADLAVDRQQVVALLSDDQGRSWRHTAMHRFDQEHAGGAEAWVVELSDGRLLGTSWHLDHSGEREYPNAWSLSSDRGESWTPTCSTGIMGQSTALAPLPEGQALFIYNQRRQSEVGVWLAVVEPTATDFGLQSNQIVWHAETATQSDSTGEHSQWQDFSFGEPAVAVMPDGTLLVVFWCIQPDGQGVKFVRLRAS